MNVGIVTAMLRWKRSVFDQIDWAVQNGFANIELSCWSAHEIPGFEGLWAHRWDDDGEFTCRVREAIAPFQRVDLHASFNHACDAVYATYHPLCRDIYIDEILWAMRLAASLGGQVVTCHSGWLVHGREQGDRERGLVQALRRLDEAAQEHNVVVGMETLEYFLPLEFCELMRDLQLKQVKLTLDIGHMHRSSPVGVPLHPFSRPAYDAYDTPVKFIESFASHIAHVHVHDCDGKDRSHLSLGEGVVDFSSIVKTLNAIGYKGSLSLETPGTAESILSGKSYLERLTPLSS